VLAADNVKVPFPVLVNVPDPVAIRSATVTLPAPSKVKFLFEAAITLPDPTFKVKVPESD
jgi:hypothetical protein